MPEERVRLQSNAGKPPRPDKELIEEIASLEEKDFEEVAKIIREHKSKAKIRVPCLRTTGDFEVDDRLTI